MVFLGKPFLKSLNFQNFRELWTCLYISSHPLLVFQYCAGAQLWVSHHKKKIVKIVAVCVALLGYNLFIRGQGIKEAAVPNIPSTVKLLIGTISVKRKKFHQTHGNS